MSKSYCMSTSKVVSACFRTSTTTCNAAHTISNSLGSWCFLFRSFENDGCSEIAFELHVFYLPGLILSHISPKDLTESCFLASVPRKTFNVVI